MLEKVASHLGILEKPSVNDSFPKINGILNGHSVNVTKITYQNDTESVEELKIIFELQPNYLNSFFITSESATSKISKLFGKDDIVIGDHLFDRTILIKTDYPASATS